MEKIGVGYRWGQLTIAGRTEQRKNGYVVWRCACDCGGEILLDTRAVQRGQLTDCGCRQLPSPRIRDLTGQRFGRLIAQYPTDKRGPGGSVIWHCACDCGGAIDTPSRQLHNGYVKSCGCLSHPPLKDHVGTRFGKLIVTEYAGKRGGQHIWRCLCDCGRMVLVRQTHLQNGHTTSCGCAQRETLRRNLRLSDGTSATRIEASKRMLLSNNTSGYTGVYYNKKRDRWHAQISFKGKMYFLGSYRTKDEAIAARKRGEEIHDDFLAWYYQQEEKHG